MSNLFRDVKKWRSVEAELREQGFSRYKLLIVHEIWYRLQIENIVKEYTPEELDDAISIVAEAFDNQED